jgi:hypothetical protein
VISLTRFGAEGDKKNSASLLHVLQIGEFGQSSRYQRSRPAYLRTILSNSQTESAATKSKPVTDAVAKSALEPARHEGHDQKQLVAAWKADRLRKIRSEFATLSDEEKSKWVEATQQSTPATLISPAIRKRFKEQSWESPLITQLVLDYYAGEVYGKNRVQPSAIDLAMYAAHREPGRGT